MVLSPDQTMISAGFLRGCRLAIRTLIYPVAILILSSKFHLRALRALKKPSNQQEPSYRGAGCLMSLARGVASTPWARRSLWLPIQSLKNGITKDRPLFSSQMALKAPYKKPG